MNRPASPAERPVGDPLAGAVAEVLRLEREMQTPSCRADASRMTQLLAEEFTEIGASGRVWDRESILAMLAEEAGEQAPHIEIQDLTGRVVAAGVVLVTWLSRTSERCARRSSLWCWRDGRWRLTFHQGTPLP